MRHLLMIIAIVLPLLSACGGGDEQASTDGAEGSDEVLARIGGKDITRADLDAELEKVPAFQRQEFETPAGRAQFLERMLDMEALYKAATEAGMEKDEDVLAEMDYARRQIMMKHFYKKEIEAKAEPDEATLLDYYQNNMDQFSEKEKVKARMILVEDIIAAENLADRIKGGEDFVALAGSENTDGSLKSEAGISDGSPATDTSAAWA